MPWEGSRSMKNSIEILAPEHYEIFIGTWGCIGSCLPFVTPSVLNSVLIKKFLTKNAAISCWKSIILGEDWWNGAFEDLTLGLQI